MVGIFNLEAGGAEDLILALPVREQHRESKLYKVQGASGALQPLRPTTIPTEKRGGTRTEPYAGCKGSGVVRLPDLRHRIRREQVCGIMV